MICKHSFDPVAITEYKEAIEWYGERSLAAMDNFITAVNEKISDICKTPLLYRITYKNYRETALVKFPYSIVYLINEDKTSVIITSVYHHKRDPRRKYKK